MRKYPPAQVFPRVCNRDYLVPGTNFIMKKGQEVVLPYRALHHDPEYWPEPDRFDPERFNSENLAKVQECVLVRSNLLLNISYWRITI